MSDYSVGLLFCKLGYFYGLLIAGILVAVPIVLYKSLQKIQ